jgi:type IV pilus assembly protein PilW
MKGCAVKNKLSRTFGFYGSAYGFSLVELLIAMAVGLVILGAMYSVFTIQNKTFGNQEDFVEMQQNVRAGMDMIAREVGMAGYDPAGVNSDAGSSNDFSGVTVNASQLQIQADLDGNGAIDMTSQENIVYAIDGPPNYRITRNVGSGDQAFVENVQSFTFGYLDGAGAVTTVPADVRRVKITITGRTAKPDPAYTANSGYRTYTLISIIAPRNLAY